jgi:hypothetical protein
MQAAMGTMRGMWGWGPGGAGCCGSDPGTMGSGMIMGEPMMGWGQMRGYYSGLTPEQVRVAPVHDGPVRARCSR